MPTEIYTLRNWVYKIKVHMNSVYNAGEVAYSDTGYSDTV